MALALATSSALHTARAAVISTDAYLAATDRSATLARIDTVLARAEVAERLEQHGVSAADALERAAALTDAELAELADNLDALPAGGDALGLVGAVFVVLLILELVGVINIFNSI
jgi:hypothetical protein